MKIGIHGRKFGNEIHEYILQVLNCLQDANIEVLLSNYFKEFCDCEGLDVSGYDSYNTNELADFDYFFSLGGDGTLLDTVTHIGAKEIPILGINLGRLGFLANVAKENINNALRCFLENKFDIESRSLLHLDTNQPDFFDQYKFALNEVAIMKRDTSSMIAVNCFINNKLLNSYWADGLMVSTPTGSTGYSLSCGGPVILPDSNSFCLTPVSPHNLNVRPMIIPDDSLLSFSIESSSRNFLVSLDSRSFKVDSSVKLYVKKESFKVKLIRIQGLNFIDTLRNKLNWGLDSRN